MNHIVKRRVSYRLLGTIERCVWSTSSSKDTTMACPNIETYSSMPMASQGYVQSKTNCIEYPIQNIFARHHKIDGHAYSSADQALCERNDSNSISESANMKDKENIQRARKWLKAKEVIPVKLTKRRKGGFVCRTADNIDGFIPMSCLDRETHRIVDFENKYKKKSKYGSTVGRTIQACVMEIKENTGKPCANVIMFSEKEAVEKEGARLLKQVKKGEILECRISSITDVGLFVYTKKGSVNGLIHVSEVWLPEMEEIGRMFIDIPLLKSNFKRGDVLHASVIDVNKKRKQIHLSLKAARKMQKKKTPRKIHTKTSPPSIWMTMYNYFFPQNK